jgi:two-component system, OmpR family, phosphate regulon response regulator PhoB
MAKVLVVEDDPDSLEVVSMALQRSGHAVVAASNGWEGLLALDSHHVDVIVLDLMMPGMNGNAFLRIIRNDQRRRQLPVIILTALNGGDMFHSIADLGVQEWLLKADYTTKQLLEAVDRLAIKAPPGPRSSDPWQNVRWTQRN